ncbi:MAG: DUF3179 domain-containing protein [Longimicrobiales bacterium]
MAHPAGQTHGTWPAVGTGTALALLSVLGCGTEGPITGTPREAGGIQCVVSLSDIFDGGVGKDGIPALTNPAFVDPGDPTADYITPTDRVIGLVTEGQAYAIPFNIMYFHEIVNLDLGGRLLAVTYCPLTGSSVVFDRSGIDGAEFGVSGLLFRNNLILYDRNTEESLWPQLSLAAACGTRRGDILPLAPFLEAEWAGWLAIHPDTKILARPTLLGRTYTGTPLAEYERIDNPDIPVSVPLDPRRPPKERVIGTPTALDGGTAFPFLELSRKPAQAIPIRVPGADATLFWNTEAQGGAIYLNEVAGQSFTFRASGGDIFDNETESRWGIDGQALDGAAAGTQLEAYSDAYTSFWFAWADFQPETLVWTN